MLNTLPQHEIEAASIGFGISIYVLQFRFWNLSTEKYRGNKWFQAKQIKAKTMKLTAPHVSSMESGDYVADIRGEKYNDFLNIIYSLWLHRSSTTSNLKKITILSNNM